MLEYEQTRTCSQCEQEESRKLPKLVVAFVERNRWDAPCGKCGSESFSSTSTPFPPLDKEILEAWAYDPALRLLDTDEDLILADPGALSLIQEFILRDDCLLEKRASLLAALCILVLENRSKDTGKLDDAGTNALTFLKNHLDLFEEVGDGQIYDDIKEEVYPLLGFRE